MNAAQEFIMTFNKPTLGRARPGDLVTGRFPNGKSIRRGRVVQDYKNRSGRVVLAYPDRLVLNMGGRYGTPGLVFADTLISVRRAKS